MRRSESKTRILSRISGQPTSPSMAKDFIVEKAGRKYHGKLKMGIGAVKDCPPIVTGVGSEMTPDFKPSRFARASKSTEDSEPVSSSKFAGFPLMEACAKATRVLA